MDKIKLRSYAKETRKKLSLIDISSALSQQIIYSEVFKKSHDILLYYPTKYEINLLSIITSDKNFYLPRVSGRDLTVCPYSVGDELIKSELGILEPITDKTDSGVLDLIVVPALMADKNGYRLGYGGGYYDRFLSRVKCTTVCAVPKELFVDKLPVDEFDIPIDRIFTV